MLRRALELAGTQGYPARDLLKLKAVNRQFVDKDLPGALEEYRTLREVYPENMPAWNNSGRILQSLRRYDEAAAMYEKAAEMAPHNTIPLQNLWYLDYYYRKDVRRLRELPGVLRPWLRSWPIPTRYWDSVWPSRKNSLKLKKSLKRAVELEPGHPYALPNLAHMLLASGRAAEAVLYYRKVAELGPKGEWAATRKSTLSTWLAALAAAGNKEEAAKAAADAEALALKNHGPGKPDAKDYLSLLGETVRAQGENGRGPGLPP